MRIKSYFASSVDEAMEKARRELGPEAMLLNSKKTEIELRALGAYEVVFGVAAEETRAPASPPLRVPSAQAGTSSLAETRGPDSDLARELAELRKQIETVKRSVDRRPVASPKGATLGADGAEFLERLASAGFSASMAGELAAAAEGHGAYEGHTEMELEAALRAECERRLRFSPLLGPPVGLATGTSGAEPRAVLLAGPAGAGKTTTLVKLALRYGLGYGTSFGSGAHMPLQILSLDTLRIGGWEQLACYARIAGIPCQPVHTPAALEQAFTEHRQKKLILIDTPGFSVADPPSRSLLAWLAGHRQSVEVQLVLSAAAQPRINLAILERFASLEPAKLLFTHLDEVESPGPLLETALRAGLPLSFLATGPQVPEDLEEASLERLIAPLAVSGGLVSRRVASAA
jgi:flagellar biosynthesis protein FlhF